MIKFTVFRTDKASQVSNSYVDMWLTDSEEIY